MKRGYFTPLLSPVSVDVIISSHHRLSGFTTTPQAGHTVSKSTDGSVTQLSSPQEYKDLWIQTFPCLTKSRPEISFSLVGNSISIINIYNIGVFLLITFPITKPLIRSTSPSIFQKLLPNPQI